MVSTLHPCAQSTMAAEWQLPRVRSPFSAPIPLVWADEHDRPDAAEGRLRQVYAELDGMIGGSHKSERRMLSTRSAGMGDASREGGPVGTEIAPQLTVLGEIPRGL